MQSLSLIASEIEARIKMFSMFKHNLYVKNNRIYIDSQYPFMTLSVMEVIIKIRNKYKMCGIIYGNSIRLFYLEEEKGDKEETKKSSIAEL